MCHGSVFTNNKTQWQIQKTFFFLLEQYSRYKGLLQSNTPIRTERVLQQTVCAPQENKLIWARSNKNRKCRIEKKKKTERRGNTDHSDSSSTSCSEKKKLANRSQTHSSWSILSFSSCRWDFGIARTHFVLKTCLSDLQRRLDLKQNTTWSLAEREK